MKFYVSRQKYYYNRKSVVEVTAGGLDYAGADQLVPKYVNLGEGREYTDPREAVEAAIAICRKWRKERAKGDPYPYIACGSTGGMGLELEPISITKAQEWANQWFKQLPKCDWCEGIRDEKNFYRFCFPYDVDDKYCSEHCADEALEARERCIEGFEE